MNPLLHGLWHDAAGLCRAYSTILFADKPWVGMLFIAATFVFPNTALAGLLAAASGLLTARLLAFRNIDSGLHVYNSLLVGLSLGAYYQLNSYLLVLIVLASVLAVFATVAIADMAWRLDRLPALSLPFVLVALTATLAAQSYGTLQRYLLPLMPRDTWLSPLTDQFFTALGSAFFTPHPLAGMLLFLGILITSRYLALLAVAGFLAGFSTYTILSGSPHPDLVAWNGFNFILVAMALGGVFTVPTLPSFVLALLGAVLSALVTAASETFMLVYGLPVMALPFLATTLLMLLALKKRVAYDALQLTLASPALPEISAERRRLAMVRNGESGSIGVLAPFYGRWQVYQGFDGPHTHKGAWRHALDFYITEQGRSYRSNGASLDDYYCFGLPVLSPVSGYVTAVLDGLPDNPPGKADTRNNWGNHIIIRMDDEVYVLLAHLKQGSLVVQTGAYVSAGQVLAACGSSGRSPQPHLHLHVQHGDKAGCPTLPFHLTSVLAIDPMTMKSDYRLYLRPSTGQMLMPAPTDMQLAATLTMNVGQQWHYRMQQPSASGKMMTERCLSVELSLLGEFRLVSDSGASVAFVAHGQLLACYDRTGPADLLLDGWLLAMGLTPFAEAPVNWRDQPSIHYLPMKRSQQLLAAVCFPLGAGCDSSYERQRHGHGWQQTGEHRLVLPLVEDVHVITRADIQPHKGCIGFDVQQAGQTLFTARLLSLAQKADGGIPAWQQMMTQGGES